MAKQFSFKRCWKQSAHLRIGLVLFALVLLCALLAPLLETHDPYRLDGPAKAAPGGEYWLGTDALGGDVYSMMIEGTRTSLKVGFIAALISNVMIIIGLTSWPGNARLMRVQAMSLKERVFVKSAEALGESKASILFRYIIPNGIYPVVANTAMGIASAILMEASLSFLGLGDPNIISWGQMVYAGRSYMTSAWWVATFPGIAIIITVMSFYLICDGLNTVLNPKAGKRGA